MPSKPPLERMATTSPECKLRRDASTIARRIGVQLGRRSGGIERVDNILRVQALGVGNALLLIDAGEDDAVGEAQACDEIVLRALCGEACWSAAQALPTGATAG